MRRIHFMFGVTLGVTIVYIGTQYALYQNADKSGTVSTSLTMVTDVFGFLTVFVTLSSLLFLSLGWSTLRPFLTEKETRLIVITLVSYFVTGIANAVCENNNTICDSLNLATYVLKCLVYLGIIIAMNFTVTQLRTQLMHTTWVPSVSIQYARAKQFQMFRLVFIVYLLLPTGFLLVQAILFSWKEDWLYPTLMDTLNLLFIFHTGANFSPLNDQALTRAFDGTYNVLRTE